MTEIKLYKSIITKCDNLENKFIDFFEKSREKRNISENIINADVCNLMKMLIFGVNEETPMAKLDIGKNKNLVKQLILNIPNFKDALGFLQDIIIQLEEFMNHISNDFEMELNNIADRKITSIEFIKLKYLFSSYGWECTHIRSYCSELQTLIDNSGSLATDRSELLKPTVEDIKYCKKDTMKRYYFTDTYELKNNIKYFDMDTMIFGETNSIMRMYNIITNFLFKDFLFMFNVVKTNISVLLQTTK